MADTTDIEEGTEPYIRLCQCSACQQEFSKPSHDVSETARAIATHWNEAHPDILENSYTGYREAEQERHEVESGIYQSETRIFYLTVYDVLAIQDGDNVFNPAFVENVLLNEVCEDCHTPIEDLNNYEELDEQIGPITKYLCQQCQKQREVRRRQANNKQLSAFNRV